MQESDLLDCRAAESNITDVQGGRGGRGGGGGTHHGGGRGGQQPGGRGGGMGQSASMWRDLLDVRS